MSNFEIKTYRTSKSVLPSYQFKAEFECIFNHTIQPYHVRSVSYEQHTFKHEGQYHGPGILKIFPVLDRGENGAYKLTVVMEEDQFGSVFNFIESLKRLIINESGIYNMRDHAKSTKLKLYMYGATDFSMTFENVYFQMSEGSEWSYGSSDQKTYTLNLVYENYTFGVAEQEDLQPIKRTQIAKEKPKMEEIVKGEGVKSESSTKVEPTSTSDKQTEYKVDISLKVTSNNLVPLKDSTGKQLKDSLHNRVSMVNPEVAKQWAEADKAYFEATGKHMKVSHSLRYGEDTGSAHFDGKAIDVDKNDVDKYATYLRTAGFMNAVPGDKIHFSIGESERYATQNPVTGLVTYKDGSGSFKANIQDDRTYTIDKLKQYHPGAVTNVTKPVSKKNNKVVVASIPTKDKKKKV